MTKQMQRQLVQGIISLVLGLLVTWLTKYLVDKIVGHDDDPKQLTA
jgi:hypothetical protein